MLPGGATSDTRDSIGKVRGLVSVPEVSVTQLIPHTSVNLWLCRVSTCTDRCVTLHERNKHMKNIRKVKSFSDVQSKLITCSVL